MYEAKPDPTTLKLWMVTKVLLMGIYLLLVTSPFFILFVIYRALNVIVIPMIFLYLYFIVLALILVAVALYQTPLLKTFKFKITNDEVIVSGGLINKRRKVVRFDKITDVEIAQGLFEQIFKLYRLRIQTAGMGAYMSEITFFGLTDPKTPEKIISDKLGSSK